MQEYLFKANPVLGSALLLSILPAILAGQARPVVSNQLAISQSEAALHLEFADDGTLEIALRDGAVLIDGEERGNFVRGDALDTAWRSLLGDIVSLSDGPLSEALRNWEAPSSLDDSSLVLARLLDRTLEDALRSNDASVYADAEPVFVIDGAATDLRLSLQALLSRGDLLGRLGEVLEAIDVTMSRIHIGEDVVVAQDETVEGTVVVVDADVRVAGTIEGDIIVVEGSLELEEGGRVTGDIRLVDSSYEGVDASTLAGELILIESDVVEIDALAELEDLEGLSDRLRLEMRDELRDELRAEFEREFANAEGGRRGYSPFQAVKNAAGEVVTSIGLFLLFSLIALGTVYFGKNNLEVVADAARRNPMRSGMVGLAGAFLIVPTWALGTIALAVSVVGLIALPFWVLLFPIAVGLGAGLGYLAVARNVGEWVAAREINGLEWLRPTNTFYAITAGIGTLFAFSVTASVLDIVPFFGFFSGLLATLGGMATVAVLLIGFGAVLLTRGGREADFYDGDDSFGGVRWQEESGSEEVLEADEVEDESDTTGTKTGGGGSDA